jgi:hypothetical protein
MHNLRQEILFLQYEELVNDAGAELRVTSNGRPQPRRHRQLLRVWRAQQKPREIGACFLEGPADCVKDPKATPIQLCKIFRQLLFLASGLFQDRLARRPSQTVSSDFRTLIPTEGNDATKLLQKYYRP